MADDDDDQKRVRGYRRFAGKAAKFVGEILCAEDEKFGKRLIF